MKKVGFMMFGIRGYCGTGEKLGGCECDIRKIRRGKSDVLVDSAPLRC